MTSVPCIELNCELRDQDKNNTVCENCRAKLAYVDALGDSRRPLPDRMMDAWSPKKNPPRLPPEKEKKNCILPGCDQKVFSRGLCQNHYTRLLRGTIFRFSTKDYLEIQDAAGLLRAIVQIANRFGISTDEVLIILIDEGLKQYAARAA